MEKICYVLSAFLAFSYAFKYPSQIQELEKRVTVQCLLRGEFYHRKSRRCQSPFVTGPCEAGEWLEISQTHPGTVLCQPWPERLSRCLQVGLGPRGEAECASDFEAELFLPCEAGAGIRVPHNFMEDTRPCSEGFRCQARNPLYMSAIKMRQRRQDKTRKQEFETEFLRGLVCDAKSMRLCLPEDNREPLISAENIVNSYQRPRALCKRNPCPSGKWPWLDKDGFFRCLPASKSVEKCMAKIRENNGNLQCEYLSPLSLLGYIPTSLCRRNQIYRFGKCRSRFFG